MHANDCKQALWKLDTFVAEAGVPPQRELIGNAIELVVFIEKTETGRRITQMRTVHGYNGAEFNLTPVM
jgi:Flp pilus assembly CpaF family ATPase